MIYSKKQFAKDLKKQLQLGYDAKKIARWAYIIYLDYCNSFEPGLREIVMEIVITEEGLEFEMPEEELVKVANKLEIS